MNRLFYEKEDEPIVAIDVAPEEETPTSKTRSYLTKVSSIVPAEIIAGYLAMVGFLDKEADQVFVINRGLLIGIFIFCLVLTPLYIYFQALKEKDKPKFTHMLMSTLAFMVWAFVTSGEKFNVDFYSAEVSSVILVGFSLVSGLIPLKK